MARPMKWPPYPDYMAATTLSIADRVAAAGTEPMSMEEIDAEVKTVRAERRQRAGGH